MEFDLFDADETGGLTDPSSVRTLVLQLRGDGAATSVNLFGRQPNEAACDDVVPILIIGGSGFTDGGGAWSLELETVVCDAVVQGDFDGTQIAINSDLKLVATPHGSRPSVLTTTQDTAGTRTRIGVRSWSLSGDEAPGVSFDWHCMVTSREGGRDDVGAAAAVPQGSSY